MSNKKKKKKAKWNENAQIRSAMRRVFSRSPIVQELLREGRQEEPKYNKDGALAKKPKVTYDCQICGKRFGRKDIAVDHIKPVIDIDGTFVDWNTFKIQLFCSKDNLQRICSYKLKDNYKYDGLVSCHNQKTRKERCDRKILADKVQEICE